MNELLVEMADTLQAILTALNNIEAKIDSTRDKTKRVKSKVDELQSLVRKEKRQ